MLDIFVAKDQPALGALMLARDPKDWSALGMALGYPKSAVDSFSSGDKMFVHDLPLETQLSEAAQFVGFVLSKNNWKNELEQVKDWVGVIKDASPIVYHQYLNRFSDIDRELAEKVMRRISE